MKQDYIYGLLGMASDLEGLGIEVDYSESVSAIYTQVTSALVGKQKQLSVLTRCQFPKSVADLPSWVPDWSQKERPSIWRAEYKLYDAGGPSILQSIQCDNTHLTVSGYEVDIVH
jgi:hypothetical protein